MGENDKQSEWKNYLKRAAALWKEGLKEQALSEGQGALDSCAASAGVNSKDYIDCTIAAGDLLISFGMGMEALGVYNRAREMADFNLGENNSYKPKILLGLSSAYELQNFQEEAKLYEELALEALSETKWESIQDYVPILGQIASSLGEDPLFKTLSDNVVTEISSISTDALSDLSEPLLKIAANLFSIGESEKAILLMRRLVDFHERFNNDMLTKFLSVLEIGMSACELSGDLETALRWGSLAYEINADVYGTDSFEVACATIPLVRILLQFGEIEESIRLCEHALSIVKPASEDEDFKLEEASIRKYLGESFCALRDFNAARENLLLAYEIYRAHERTSDPAVAETLHNLGVIALTDGALDDALHFLGKGYAIREKIFGAQHESVAKSLIALGACHEARGSLDDAKRCQNRAREIEIALFGEEKRADKKMQELSAVSDDYNESALKEASTEIIEESSSFPASTSTSPSIPNIKAIVSIVRAAKTLILTKQEPEALELLNEAISLIETMGGGKREEQKEDSEHFS